MQQISLRFTGAIASAVAAEITRLQQHPDLWTTEGGAYKAAWDRAGSDAMKHAESFRRDCQLSSYIVVTKPARNALAILPALLPVELLREVRP